MKVLSAACALLAVVVVAGQPRAGDGKAVRYKLVSMVIDRQKVPPKDLEGLVLTIKGDKGVMTKGGKVYSEATSTVDMTKKPWTIDLVLTGGEKKGEKLVGIVKEEGDRMTVCFAPEGKPRPTEFSSK